MPAQHTFQAPTGTRDFYPLEMAKSRWLHEQWRAVSIRHGFDEIDGPTFEHLDLYTAKSGEGIVSELFSFRRAGGDKDFALRPEFTPTLARMYAAKANSLPKPTKWFCVPNFFRAERPQRGRLREFYQWNVDLIGSDDPSCDAEIMACCVDFLSSAGLTHNDVKLRVNDRRIMTGLLEVCGVREGDIDKALLLIDRRGKIGEDVYGISCDGIGFDHQRFDSGIAELERGWRQLGGEALDKPGIMRSYSEFDSEIQINCEAMSEVLDAFTDMGLAKWCVFDPSIVRGLAYYTGTVFEVIADGERAVAGGGRYDNLIELCGGPPTPAVGFAMGDVVLSLLLQDKGLMPSDDEIADQLGLRPDVFVIPSPDVDPQQAITLMSQLRRYGLHTRRSYKSTRNVSKLLKDATNARAKLAVIVESPTTCTLRNLDTNEQHESLPLDQLQSAIHTQLAD